MLARIGMPSSNVTTRSAESEPAEEILGLENEDSHKLPVLRIISLLAIGVSGFGAFLFGVFYFLFQEPAWFYFTLVCLVNTLLYLTVHRLSRSGLHYRSVWALLSICFISLISAQALMGTRLFVVLPILACLGVMAVLLPSRFVLGLMSGWILFSLALYLFQYGWPIYRPWVAVSDSAALVGNIFVTGLIGSIFIPLLLLPTRQLQQTLRFQRRQLQTLLLRQTASEARLRESEQRLRATFEQVGVGICQLDSAGRWLFANPRLCELLGYSREELLRLNYKDTALGALFDFEAVKAGAEYWRQEKSYQRSDGSLVWVNLTVAPIDDEAGNTFCYTVIVEDITERKQAQDQIAFQASLLDQVRSGIVASDTDGNVIYYNAAAVPFFPPNEPLMGRNLLRQTQNPDNQRYLNLLHKDLYATGAGETQLLISPPNGEQRAIFVTASALRSATGQIQGYVGVVNDVSERRQVEQALAAEKERLSVTLRSIGDGVITTDTAGHVTLLNGVAETQTGWELTQALGQPLAQVFRLVDDRTDEPAPNPAEQVLTTGQIVGLRSRTALVARDGKRRFVSCSAAPIRDESGQIGGVVLVFRDITERYRLEEEMQRSQRLESVGLLAGGIAHDFNNILTSIAGNISLAKLEIEPGAKAFGLLGEAERATLRATGLTQQLLTFAQGGAPIKQVVSLAELLKESANFALRGSSVGSRFDLPADLWPVEVDANQINQVINNLVINAVQAMPHGGQLQITARNVPLAELQPAWPLNPGSYVEVAVRDEGVGISPANLNRIFEPYFTTKPRGNGLGLATCYSIISKHAGHIRVESSPDQGTTFYFYLPAQPALTLRPGKTTGPLVTGTGRILLMDDDKMLRELGVKALNRLGYQTEAVADGQEALRLYRQNFEAGQPYDLLIMDLTVPGGMGGQEAVSLIHDFDPAVRAIVSSGYSNDPIMANYRKYHFQEVLTKPFRLEELSAKIQRVLNPPSSV